MLVLILFALLAGAGTALSPCVLPVLPALLSAGQRRRPPTPAGRGDRAAVTFTVTIVGVASVVGGVGLGADPLRWLAVVVLIVLRRRDDGRRPSRARIEAPLSRLARFGPKNVERRLPLGPARRRRARLCLHALREPGARGRDLRRRGQRARRGPRRRLRGRVGDRPARACARRPLADGPRAPRRPRPGDPARRSARSWSSRGSRSPIGLDVNFDQFVAQHIPNVNLTASLECSHGVTERLHAADRPAREVPPGERFVELRRRLLDDPRRCGRRLPGRAARRRAAAAGRSARRRNSPTPSSGSTPPAAQPLHARASCAARSCSSTSGPTRASTASARCPT